MYSYSEDDATHNALCISYSQSIVIEGIDVQKLFEHSQKSRYSIYKLTGRDHNEDSGNIHYAILLQDYSEYWRTPKRGGKTIAIDSHDNVEQYIDLDKKNIEFALKAVPTSEKNGIKTYFLQRTLWSQDQDIPTRPSKRLEYEGGYQLWLQLSDLLPQVSSNLDNQELKDKSSLLLQGSNLNNQKLKLGR